MCFLETEKMRSGFEKEAVMHSIYRLYGEKAREEGLHAVADELEHAALNELAHARWFMDRLGELGSTEENLTRAASLKRDAASNYVEWYDSDGEPTLRALADVEKDQQRNWDETLREMREGARYCRPSAVAWECVRCGFGMMGREAPMRCPLCGAGQGSYKRK